MNETAAIVAACGHLCHVPAALRSDLKERGMLARTVVVVLVVVSVSVAVAQS